MVWPDHLILVTRPHLGVLSIGVCQSIRCRIAARKLRDRKDCWAFLLSEEEQRSICIYRREGRMAELPTFPGPGVTDRDAGVFLSFASEYDVA